MKTKIQKDKWLGIEKLAKNKEIQLYSQSWYIQNTSSILLIHDKKRNTSSMKELFAILPVKGE